MSFPGIKTDNIRELTENNGILIEDILLKDDEITFNSNSLEIKSAFDGLKNPTGFPDSTTQISTFTNGTLLFEISPVGDDFTVFIQGVKYVKDSTEDIEIADTEGIHYIYYDTDGVLQELVNPTGTQIQSMIINETIVAIIYWDADGSQQIYFTGNNEYHGTVMTGATHAYLHCAIGAKYISGMAPSNIVADGDGDINASGQFGVVSGIFYDEDLTISLSTIASTVGLPIYYLDSASADWRRSIVAGYSVLNETSLIAWNEYTGGAWQQTQAGSGNFVLCHIFGSNDSTYNYISIQGQNEYTSVNNARNGAETEIISMYTIGLPFAEFVPIATFIFETRTTYDNGVKGRIRSTGSGDDFVDWRSVTFAATGITSTNHGALSGLDGDDHIQYALLAGRSGGQQIIGGTGSGDDLIFDTTSDGTKGSYIFTDLEVSKPIFTDGSSGLTTSVIPSTIDMGSGSLQIDNIIESTGSAGITLGHILKVDNIVESTGSAGITLEEITIRDEAIRFNDQEFIAFAGIPKGIVIDNSKAMIEMINTDTYSYPGFSIYSDQPDNSELWFGCYYNSGYKSSTVNSNFTLKHLSGDFQLQYDSGKIAGNALSLKTGISLDASADTIDIPICTLKVDNIAESTGSAGITIIDVLKVDNIVESTGSAGITLEEITIRDEAIRFNDQEFVAFAGIPKGIVIDNPKAMIEMINTDTYSYPGFSIYADKPDNSQLWFGCHYDSGYKSSSNNTTNYLIHHWGAAVGGPLLIQYGSGHSYGDAISWSEGFALDGTGNIRMLSVYSHDMNGETIRDLMINNTGELGYDSGSLTAIKTNVSFDPDVSFLYDIDICSYNYKQRISPGWTSDCFSDTEYHDRTEYGCMVEQLHVLNTDMCFYDEIPGETEEDPSTFEARGIHWKKMIPAMLKCIQVQKASIDTLNQQVIDLTERIVVLEGS